MSGVLNRWKVAVQAAAFDVGTSVSGVVSTAVLGEEYEKNYEFPRDSTASGGHELLWKIYPAVSKKTGAEVSLFVFDKRELDKVHNKERVLDVLRHDMKTLRLLRHPQILKIEEVFDESRKTLSFVTERVTCSLGNACKNFTNVLNVTPEVLEIGLSEFEIACGLMHIGESLSFLHREGRRVHLGLSPNAIFITPKGEWKLGGMGFSRIVEPGATSRSEYYASGHAEPIKKGEKLLSYEPPLEYCAPELVNEPRTFDAHADVFSLGLLVLELFSPPKPDGSHEPVLGYLEGKVMTHGYKTQSLHPISFNPTVPVTLHNTIRTLLQLSPSSRIEARAFLSSPFFDSGLVKTLRTLQTLVEQDPASQAKFLLALPDVLSGFSPKVLRDLVLPGLQSVVINPAIAPFVITPLLKIVSMVDKTTFSRHIAPMMVPLLTIAEPVQCMLMFVENLEALIPKAEDGYIRDHIVPMLCRALDSSVPEILDKVLNKIVDQASLFEYRILKQIILPRVIRLILDPPQLSVRVNALLWLAKSFHVFDKDLLVESVMPCLAECLAKDKTPAVCMCILGCYDNLGKHLGPEYMAKLVLPAVSPLLWEKNLNGAQFDMVCERVNAMLKEIISEREKALMAESGLQTQSVATSGFGETVRAVERNKEKASGMAAVNSMLQDEYVPKAPEAAQKPSDPAPYSDARPSTYSDRSSTSSRDDPFILNGGGRSAATPPKEAPSESYAERRRAKKATRRTSASVDAPTSDLLEIATVAAPAYGNAPSAGLAGLSLAPAPAPGGNMFAGLQPSSYAPSSFAAAPPSSGYGGTPGYGQNTAVSAFNGAPLLAAPPVAAPSYNNNSNGNAGGYGNQFGAPPPAAPGYGQPQLGYANNYASTPYGNAAPQQQQLYASYTGHHPTTQDDGNKFSAFDGL